MIQVRDLWKTYHHHEAVRGISFRVPEGSAYALIGANGAGKTTTLKMLMNMLVPTRGVAAVMGTDSRKLSTRQRNEIGYVSENQEFPTRLTVAEYFDYLRPFYAHWDRQLEGELRVQLRLPAERAIGALSHGMRMKMALTSALAFRPRLLILDEPFSGLDPLVRDEFMEGMVGQAGEMTVLISSHELAEIEGFATHVAFMEEGSLVFDESMPDLTERFRRMRVTLDHTAELAQEMPKEWIHMRVMGNVVEFVDTGFVGQDCRERLEMFFDGVRHLDAEAMPLRSIFTALARAERATTPQGRGAR